MMRIRRPPMGRSTDPQMREGHRKIGIGFLQSRSAEVLYEERYHTIE
jgi:hypothetical protein